MRRVVLVASIVMLLGPPASAQEKPIDTQFIRDFAATRGFMLGRPAKAMPTPDGKAVLFLRSPPRSPVMHLFEFDVATGKTRELLTPETLLKGAEEKLTPEEKARRERMRVTARGFADFQLSKDGSQLLASLSGRLYVVNRQSGEARELPTGKGTIQDPKFSPDGLKVSYVLNKDVFVLDLGTMKEHRITTSSNSDTTHGLAEFIAQEEMGRFSGYWWSPDSRWIAYQETNSQGVEVWKIADPAKPGEPPHEQHYPRPGKNNVRVRLGITTADGQKIPFRIPSPLENTIWIDWPREKYPYLATVNWDKGGPLTIVVQDRLQQELLVLAVDPKTGKTTTLLTETDAAWINLDQDVPRWLEDGSGFLWISERGGGPQLEFRSPNGELVRALVAPNAGFQGLVEVDEKAKQVYFRASTDPTQGHLWRVPLEGGKPERLTENPGQHVVTFGKAQGAHGVYVRRSSGPKEMPRSSVMKIDGTVVGELPEVAEEPPFTPITDFVRMAVPVEVEKTVTDAATGLKLRVKEIVPREFHCAITRPRDFDAKKRYPVIVDVYGGPGHQHVLKTMGMLLRPQWMADQGFIVVAIDGRGTPGRGREWERAIYRSFGTIPLDDQVTGLKALGQQFPELDLDRVGVTGWSFGGYMSALAVLRRPDVFKAAVAGAPVTDWEDYDTHYTERYLGLPEQNKEGYKESNLLTYAADLKRPLLLIHGTADDNVFFLHTLKLADALFKAGKDFDLLPLSGLTHMVPDPATRARLEERIVGFFRKHL